MQAFSYEMTQPSTGRQANLQYRHCPRGATRSFAGHLYNPVDRFFQLRPPVNILLNDVEARVLGALMEKDATTPDYYPLSLNALVNACNQKNNRDPVMNLDDAGVADALLRCRKSG